MSTPNTSSSLSTLEKQRQLLAAKLASQQPVEFTSPTDQMMTPVSKKLADHKKKAYTKAKPNSLASRLRSLGGGGGALPLQKKEPPPPPPAQEDPFAAPGQPAAAAASAASAASSSSSAAAGTQ